MNNAKALLCVFVLLSCGTIDPVSPGETEDTGETEGDTTESEETAWCCYCRASTLPPTEIGPCASTCMARPSSGCPEFDRSIKCVGTEWEAADHNGAPVCWNGEAPVWDGDYVGCPGSCGEK